VVETDIVLTNSPGRYYSYADETGITDLPALEIHQFRERNELGISVRHDAHEGDTPVPAQIWLTR
jgi:hypothetical protein